MDIIDLSLGPKNRVILIQPSENMRNIGWRALVMALPLCSVALRNKLIARNCSGLATLVKI